jgi:hypothetical protein
LLDGTAGIREKRQKGGEKKPEQQWLGLNPPKEEVEETR